MKAESYKYCPFYCEENIWQLCTDIAADQQQWLVLIISNPIRQVALWQQRAGNGAQRPIIWDYHVIAAQRQASGWWIWDLDSRCELPTTAADYLRRTFQPVPAALRPMFRVMTAANYRATLNSDRRHMRDASGKFLQTPPDWPTIGSGDNLQRLIDMHQHGPDDILDLAALKQKLATND